MQKIERDKSLPRVETGPVQFGEDWPGLFIRGDNSCGLMLAIKNVVDFVKRQPDWSEVCINVLELEGFAGDIENRVIQK